MIEGIWPKAGMTLFAETDGDTDRSTACLPVTPNWAFYRYGFQLSVLALLDKSEEDPDFLVFPIVYNLRHAIELSLKEIMDDAGAVVESGHNLQKLWLAVQPHLQPVSKADNEAIGVVGGIIDEIHSWDRASTSFRYPVDMKGAVSISPKSKKELQRRISLAHMREAALATFHFLDSVIERLNWDV